MHTARRHYANHRSNQSFSRNRKFLQNNHLQPNNLYLHLCLELSDKNIYTDRMSAIPLYHISIEEHLGDCREHCQDYLFHHIVFLIVLITLHGLPTARELSGISFTTTLPAPMTQLSPIVTPGTTVTLAPNHTLLPTRIGLAYSSPRFLSTASSGCPAV